MTTLDEQAARHKATMEFFQSGKQLAEAIAAELKRIDAEKRMQLEDDYQNRMLKPVVNEDE